MKALMLVLLIPLLANAQQSRQVWAIEGEVLSVVEGGILVFCHENTKVGMPKPNAGDVVYIDGKFPNATDGDKVNCQAYETGKYKYESAGNAAKTVRAFEIRH